MSEASPVYRVLARKYRPRTFSEVVGQDHIVRALGRAVDAGRVGQAYMLVGPRGVGKTSTARILAKALNCEKGPTTEPCLECPACIEIERGNDLDVIEIDGASNNGVDDVRSIRDAVHTRPIRDRRKIYIIDEVQRLSGQAFDALLKTLEEPPEHAMFLFATTDPHKIPDTIVSRCQTFEFRRLREVDIRSKLEQVCVSEGVSVAGEVLEAIARGCRGGMRDAESMLDQVLAAAGETVSLDDLESVAGLARPERWLELFEALEQDDAATVLRSVASFLERGGTERDYVEQAADALRDLLHIALLGEDALGVEPAEERRVRTIELARRFGRDRMEGVLGMLFSLESRMQRSPLAARALLEWTLLRAARIGSFFELGALLSGDSSAPLPRVAAPAPAPAARPAGAAPPASAAPAAAAPPASAGAVAAAPAVTPDKAPASSAAPTPAPAAEPAPAPAVADLATLLAEASRQRPTLGALLGELHVSGEVSAHGVALLLREPGPRDRAMLEDSFELAALAKLPGSPGPWTLTIEVPKVGPDDPIGARLIESFGGQEETP